VNAQDDGADRPTFAEAFRRWTDTREGWTTLDRLIETGVITLGTAPSELLAIFRHHCPGWVFSASLPPTMDDIAGHLGVLHRVDLFRQAVMGRALDEKIARSRGSTDLTLPELIHRVNGNGQGNGNGAEADPAARRTPFEVLLDDIVRDAWHARPPNRPTTLSRDRGDDSLLGFFRRNKPRYLARAKAEGLPNPTERPLLERFKVLRWEGLCGKQYGPGYSTKPKSVVQNT
jgi:hypothetical protein